MGVELSTPRRHGLILGQRFPKPKVASSSLAGTASEFNNLNAMSRCSSRFAFAFGQHLGNARTKWFKGRRAVVPPPANYRLSDRLPSEGKGQRFESPRARQPLSGRVLASTEQE